MEFCACYAENQIGLNACALKAASNHHSAFLWFSLRAYKRCLQLRCCNLVCSEKRVRSSSVFFLSGPQYSYWHNTEGAVQPPDQEIPQPCFGVCLYRFITQIVSYCNQVFLFCVPKCGGFLWLMAWVLFSYLNPDLQGSPSSGLIQNFKTPADVVSELIFKKIILKPKLKAVTMLHCKGHSVLVLTLFHCHCVCQRAVISSLSHPLFHLKKYHLSMRKLWQFLSFFMLYDLLHKHQYHHGRIIAQNYCTWENTQVNWPADCLLVCQ